VGVPAAAERRLRSLVFLSSAASQGQPPGARLAEQCLRLGLKECELLVEGLGLRLSVRDLHAGCVPAVCPVLRALRVCAHGSEEHRTEPRLGEVRK